MKVRITKTPLSFNNTLLANGGPLLAMGGYHSNGIDWNNKTTLFNTGSTHELNGNEGIPQGHDLEGTSNLVEQGEVKWDDYIFSNRLTVPTRKELLTELKLLPEKEGGDSQRGWEIRTLKKYAGMTYADAAKKVTKEIEERPNDPISNRSADALLQVLANSQEKQRAIEQAEELSEELKSISDKEYNDAKEQELAQQEAELQLIEQLQAAQQLSALMQEKLLMLMLLQAGIDPLQFALMQPELQLQIIALILQLMQLQLPLLAQMQQTLTQLPLMAYGGNIRALGGDNTLAQELQLKYILAIHQYMMSLGESEDTNALQVYAQYAELAQKDLMLAIKFALPYFLEYVKLLQYAALYAQGGDMSMEASQEEGLSLNEELQELDLFGNIDNPEDLSTTDLNNTIDLIILYARLNGLKQIVKAGRKAKKGSRDDKEEFVEDSIDDIREIEAQRQLEANLQQLQEDALMLELQMLELAMLEQAAQQEVMLQLAMQELMMQLQMALLQGSADAGAELDSTMPLLFAMGGKINKFDDGGYAEFKKKLEQSGKTLKDYTDWAFTNGYESLISNGELVDFNYNLANQYLSSINNNYTYNLSLKQTDEITKKIDRYYRQKGINPKKLTGRALKAYLDEVKNIIDKQSKDTNYDFTKDTTLNINNSSIKDKRTNAVNYLNLADDNYYINAGAKKVNLVDNQVPWELKSGYNRIQNPYSFNKDSNRWTVDNKDIDFDKDDLLSYGIYQYTPTNLSFNNTYDWDKFGKNFNDPNIKPANLKDLHIPYLRGKEADAVAKAQEETQEYKDFWNKIKELGPEDEGVKNLLAQLSNKTGKLYNPKTKEELNKLIDNNAFDLKRGYWHNALTALNNALKGATAYSTYVKDPSTGDYVQVLAPEGFDPSKGTLIGEYKDDNNRSVKRYELPWNEANRTLLYRNNGDVWDVTNAKGLKTRTLNDSPYSDAETPYGTTGKTTWVLEEDNNNGNPPEPTPSTWPYLAAGIGLLGAGLYSAFRPSSPYGNMLLGLANGLNHIEVQPEFIGDYSGPHIFDPRIAEIMADASTLSTMRKIENTSGGNAASARTGIVAADYANLLGRALLERQGLEYNADWDYKDKTFNKDTNKFNAEARMKAALANQDAYNRARLMQLSTSALAYAMMDNDRKDREQGIASSISGLTNLLYNYGRDADLRNLLAYDRYVNGRPGSYTDETLKKYMGDNYNDWYKKYHG